MAVKKQRMKLVLCLSLVIGMIFSNASGRVALAALSDGAYLVSRTTYYINPETGATEDGGSNTALGESMIESVLDSQVLVEQVNGKTYVTLGIGLMSSISDISIEVQTSKGGSYKKAAITKTGSCTRTGDTCNHYRFEVVSTSYYISPTLYVTAMGREVQFFIKLNMSSAVAGTGSFVAEMAGSVSSDTVSEETEEVSDSDNGTTTDSETMDSDKETGSETTGSDTTTGQETTSGQDTATDTNTKEDSDTTTGIGTTTGQGTTSGQGTISDSDTSTGSGTAEDIVAEDNTAEDSYDAAEETEEAVEEENNEESVEVEEEVDVENRLEEAEGITVYRPQTEEEAAELIEEIKQQTIPIWDIVALIITVVSCIGIGDYIGRKRMEKVNEAK